MSRWEIRRLSAVRRRPSAWDGPRRRFCVEAPDASDRRASPLALADTAMSFV
ncbi:hypothetical protein OG985_44495 [Streptomyces sp. NBC_00289]|uniref:hypothetical protein n=1 Tax=Streptomyces sp. NBC_00289 TaxID=2975703 RepID=UPI0032510874